MDPAPAASLRHPHPRSWVLPLLPPRRVEHGSRLPSMKGTPAELGLSPSLANSTLTFLTSPSSTCRSPAGTCRTPAGIGHSRPGRSRPGALSPWALSPLALSPFDVSEASLPDIGSFQPAPCSPGLVRHLVSWTSLASTFLTFISLCLEAPHLRHFKLNRARQNMECQTAFETCQTAALFRQSKQIW